jgi:hypothetical protein
MHNWRIAMIQPDGRASLDVRERYLHRRSRRRLAFGDRGVVAVWIGLATLVAWLFIAGFAGLTH